MPKNTVRFTKFLFASYLIIANAFAEPTPPKELGSFQLKSAKKGTVIAFLSTKCPCSKSHLKHLEELKNEHPDFQFIGVYSNLSENWDSIETIKKEYGIDFLTVEDRDQKTANLLEAAKTPHVFIVNPALQIVYQGGVSDSVDCQNSKRKFLKTALEQMEEGKEPSPSKTRALGCQILR